MVALGVSTGWSALGPGADGEGGQHCMSVLGPGADGDGGQNWMECPDPGADGDGGQHWMRFLAVVHLRKDSSTGNDSVVKNTFCSYRGFPSTQIWWLTDAYFLNSKGSNTLF